jgi:hypothetical protein
MGVIATIVLGVGWAAIALREGSASDGLDARRDTIAASPSTTTTPPATSNADLTASAPVPIDPKSAPLVTTSAAPKSTLDRLPLAASVAVSAASPSAPFPSAPSPSPSQAPPATVADTSPTAQPIATVVPPPTAPPPTAPPAMAPQPAFDPTTGRVGWTVSGAGGGATATNVSRALARAAGSWTGCYQAGLRARGARVEGAATLRLTCDEEGRVIGATISGIDMPDVAACIRRTAIGSVVPNVDTGAAWATIALTFQVAK